MKNQVPDNWYETFFSGINCELWEKAVSNDWTEKELSFLSDTLNLSKGASILDIPCGNGRLAIPFARKGFNVTCVDISQEFITGLTQKLKKEDLPIRVIRGNVLLIELPGTFDGAYCVGNSFGYFDYEGMKVFVRNVAAALKPGARFIINSGMMAESILPGIPAEKVYTVEGLTMQVNNVYMVDDSYMISHLKYTKNNLNEEHSYKHFVYTIGEIRRLLELFGLKIIAMYDSVDKTPYKLGSAQVYLVAEKMHLPT